MSHIADVFRVLHDMFFDGTGNPVPFDLRPKQNTQDDPFDQYVIEQLNARTPKNLVCQASPGPLVTPDMVFMDMEKLSGAPNEAELHDPDRLFGIEVKKLERAATGAVARASGLDYNSTPPCGSVRVYLKAQGSADVPVKIRCFYLFACLETTASGRMNVTALALCDGNVLNKDYDYYLSIAGQRLKEIGVGTYGDGANRNRPMVIFANPLGANQFSRGAVLICESPDLVHEDSRFRKVGEVIRTRGAEDDKDAGSRETFYCYRMNQEGKDQPYFSLVDPFPTPKSRKTTTTGRGRFRLTFS